MLESEVWRRVWGWYKPSVLWACGGLSGGNTLSDLLFKEFLDCKRVRMMQEDQAGGFIGVRARDRNLEQGGSSPSSDKGSDIRSILRYSQ